MAVGISVDEGENITIAENTVTNTQKDIITNHANPIAVSYLSNCRICNNNLSGNADCVKIHLCSNSAFQSNIIDNGNGPGLYVSSSSNCTFSENCILNNSDAGIKMWYCNTSSFVGNRVEGCGVGISVSYSFGNRIFHNSFVNNTDQAFAMGSTNYWDNGYPSGGNFWSDYSDRYPEASELNDSGLWDTPYIIDESSQDNYPIVWEFSFLLFPLMFAVTTLTIVMFLRMDECTNHTTRKKDDFA
jgi:parallel beta-helix repeat protein